MRLTSQALCQPIVMKPRREKTQDRSQPGEEPGSTASGRLSRHRLKAENRQFQGTAGISQENREHGFVPAFHDRASGRNVISRYADGTPAPVHVMDGLPAEWIAEYDESGHALAARKGVIAGFLRDGIFYTREEAARAA